MIYFYPDNTAIVRLKPNGHYCIQGEWIYPKNYNTISKSIDHASLTINNEKILVGNMSLNGQWSII